MDKLKIIITAILIIVSGLLIRLHHFGSYPEDHNFFTHLFYIPIIVTAYWWQYRVIPVIIILMSIVLGADILSGKTSMISETLIRSVFFFIVGITVAYLRNVQKNQFQLKIYRDILYSMQEAVVIIDKSYNIILTNYSFEKVFNPMRKSISDIYTLLNNEEQMNEFQENAIRSFCGESVKMGVNLQNDSGIVSYYIINFYPLKDDSGIENLILSFRDVSEQRRNEMLQKKALERQRISIEVLELINRKKSDPGLINDILVLIREKTGIDALVINLKSGDQYYKFESKSLLDRLTGAENDIITVSDSVDFQNPVIPGFDHMFYKKIAGESIFWTNNLTDYCREFNLKIAGIADFFLSCAVIPLKNGNEITGYIMLLDRREDFFNEELIVFFQAIVESIEIAMNRIEYELNLENMIQEKEQLIKEVHHRVKNNMQVIISLISLQASRQSDDKLREMLNECQNRVRTMALVHEKLYSSDNFTSINMNAYIKSLAPMLLTSYKVDKTKVDVVIDATDMNFGLNIAIPLAQLLNEILSNVFKHAFLHNSEGEVKISLAPDHSLKNRFMLRITDNGKGLPSAVSYPQGGNLGFQLIDALVKQLKGKIAISNDNGVSIEILFSDN